VREKETTKDFYDWLLNFCVQAFCVTDIADIHSAKYQNGLRTNEPFVEYYLNILGPRIGA